LLFSQDVIIFFSFAEQEKVFTRES